MEQEGASLYWLYKVLYNFRLWVHCAATNTTQTSTPGIPTTGDPTKDFLVPPGWTPYSTLWVPDGKDAEGIFLPFAAVLTKGQEVLVLIRCVLAPDKGKAGCVLPLQPELQTCSGVCVCVHPGGGACSLILCITAT